MRLEIVIINPRRYGALCCITGHVSRDFFRSFSSSRFRQYSCQNFTISMPTFRNPQNNHVVRPDNASIVIGAFLLGPIFFFCIGEIGHAFGNLLLGLLLWTILLGWIVWIGYAFAAPGIVRNKWLTKGYIEE